MFPRVRYDIPIFALDMVSVNGRVTFVIVGSDAEGRDVDAVSALVVKEEHLFEGNACAIGDAAQVALLVSLVNFLHLYK